jgi:hypothetical protein
MCGVCTQLREKSGGVFFGLQFTCRSCFRKRSTKAFLRRLG